PIRRFLRASGRKLLRESLHLRLLVPACVFPTREPVGRKFVMSKPLQYLLAIVVALGLASVGLTMFGLPPNLPLGPLQGMFAEEEVAPVVNTPVSPACPA